MNLKIRKKKKSRETSVIAIIKEILKGFALFAYLNERKRREEVVR